MIDPGGDLEPVLNLLEVEDLRLEVVHCPGHTRGHVACFHAASWNAFVSDAATERWRRGRET